MNSDTVGRMANTNMARASSYIQSRTPTSGKLICISARPHNYIFSKYIFPNSSHEDKEDEKLYQQLDKFMKAASKQDNLLYLVAGTKRTAQTRATNGQQRWTNSALTKPTMRASGS